MCVYDLYRTGPFITQFGQRIIINTPAVEKLLETNGKTKQNKNLEPNELNTNNNNNNKTYCTCSSGE